CASRFKLPDFVLSEVSSAFGRLDKTAFCVPAVVGFTVATSAVARSLTSDLGAGIYVGNSSTVSVVFCELATGTGFGAIAALAAFALVICLDAFAGDVT